MQSLLGGYLSHFISCSCTQVQKGNSMLSFLGLQNCAALSSLSTLFCSTPISQGTHFSSFAYTAKPISSNYPPVSLRLNCFLWKCAKLFSNFRYRCDYSLFRSSFFKIYFRLLNFKILESKSTVFLRSEGRFVRALTTDVKFTLSRPLPIHGASTDTIDVIISGPWCIFNRKRMV